MPTMPGQTTGTASIPLPTRLARKTRYGQGDGCYEWLGALTSHGYGDMTLNGRRVGVHRAAYEHYVGAIPDGLSVLHRCDNRRCWRPDHLFLGTQADNMADKKAKGRAASRSRNGAARLTDEQYEAIERRAAAGEPQVALAREFGITPQAVCQYLKRRRAS